MHRRSRHTVLTHPFEIPDGTAFLVHGTTNFSLRLISLLRLVRPATVFLGMMDEPMAVKTAPEDAVVLITEPDWSDRVDVLRGLGWPAERIMVLPLADDTPNNRLVPFLEKFGGDLYRDAADGGVLKRGPDLFERILLASSHIAVGANGAVSTMKHHFPALAAPTALDRERETIDRVASALADDRSRALYRSVLRDEPVRHAERFVATSLRSTQYFDRWWVEPGEVVLNCGVFDGFELPILLAMLDEEGEIVDIDPLGHRYLSRYVSHALRGFEPMVRVVEACLSDREGEAVYLEYADGQVTSNRNFMAADDQDDWAGARARRETTRLSSLVDRLGLDRVDAVKIDIEGAEEQLVPDLAPIVERFRPRLAVSVYHQVDHLWTLPAQLIAMCPDYDFHFANFSECKFESIFYCIPREQADTT